MLMVENYEPKELEDLGYIYSMMEGGYVAPNGASIVIDNRRPYNGQVLQFTPNSEGHKQNLEELKFKRLLQEEGEDDAW